MKIAIISDIHLGDPMSEMAHKTENNEIVLGSKYPDFKKTIKDNLGKDPIDYLVLTGDILDFSIVSYREAYDIGQFFFQKIQDDKIAKEIIYLAGNHDFDMWHTVEYQVNVIHRIEKNKLEKNSTKKNLPTPFKMSVPGIIDMRIKTPKENQGLSLPGVTRNKTSNSTGYGGLFLDYITEPPTPFNFVYPNLYLVTDDESILITHGQYLEAYWSVLGETLFSVASEDLKELDQKFNPEKINLKEMTGFNFPTCQLACSGIGQAGLLSKLVLVLEHEIKEKKLSRIKKMIQNAEKDINRYVKRHVKSCFTRWIYRLLSKPIYKLINRLILGQLSNMQGARFSKEFIHNEDVQERFKKFYSASVNELETLKEKHQFNIPAPQKMIFGHTHQPIAWGSTEIPSMELPQLPEGTKFSMYNTGGWLKSEKNGKTQFCGAQIFMYNSEAEKKIYSVGIN